MSLDETPGKFGRLFGSKPYRVLLRLAALFAIVFIVSHFIYKPVIVSGRSMFPTYDSGEITLVNLLAFRNATPQRGDVVAVDAGEELLLKRVIGLPTETVFMIMGVLFVDGDPLEEPYVKLSSGWTLPPHTLHEDEYLVIGDNRGMDWKDHTFGTIHRTNIIGRAMF